MTETATQTCSGTGSCGGTGTCGSDSGCAGHHHGPTSGPTSGPPSGPPELDARSIDPAIRQSAIFGVLIGLAPRAAVTIVSDQDPQPIAELVQERLPGSYSVACDQVSDREWRVRFDRT